MKGKRWLSVLCALLVFAGCAGGCLGAAGAENTLYTENEWNFADGSMDVSGGIPENATGVLERIRRSGVLRVSTENPEGADMKLAERIAERMGVRLQVIPMDYIQVMAALSEDQCDLTLSSVSYTPGRASSYTLSKGYYFPEGGSVTGLVVREENREAFRSAEDLSGRTIIAKGNSLQEALGAETIRSYREFRRAASIRNVFEAVELGRADAGIVETETARNYIKEHPDCGLAIAEDFIIQPDPHYLGYRAAAKKGEVQLMYFVNGVIDEVLESGEYEKWNADTQ